MSNKKGFALKKVIVPVVIIVAFRVLGIPLCGSPLDI